MIVLLQFGYTWYISSSKQNRKGSFTFLRKVFKVGGTVLLIIIAATTISVRSFQRRKPNMWTMLSPQIVAFTLLSFLLVVSLVLAGWWLVRVLVQNDGASLASLAEAKAINRTRQVACAGFLCFMVCWASVCSKGHLC
mmetsp:Transcript_8412/g.18209  ORF Transcript_8412/g.18209 Transcript_8412/m.18209 type:complete len:138 (-) Transcript_8412:368-781(-)